MLSQQKRRGEAARTQAEELVLTTISQHADALLRTARRHSLCADDASDAYQRGLEIFLRNAGRVDATRAASWLHKVIQHEARAESETDAAALRAMRMRMRVSRRGCHVAALRRGWSQVEDSHCDRCVGSSS
jgi:DNA-directed RNA polymerase specialized sigma24 family protein